MRKKRCDAVMVVTMEPASVLDAKMTNGVSLLLLWLMYLPDADIHPSRFRERQPLKTREAQTPASQSSKPKA